MRKFLLTWFSILRLMITALARFVHRLVDGAHYPLDKIAPLWSRLSHFHRNIIVGTGIALFISVFHNFSFISDMENKAMDWMMKMNQSHPRMAELNIENTGVKGYVLFDINQKTYQEWGEPYHIPRAQLLSLIKIAADYAKIVVVDVEISKAGIDPQADEAFVNFLQSYTDTDRADLILMRTLLPGTNKLKPLFFSKDGLSEKIKFGLPFFKVDEDSTIRRWLLSDHVCDNSQSLRMGSIQLLTDMLAMKAKPEQFERLYKQQNGSVCSSESTPPIKAEKVHYKNRTIDLHVHGIGERLIYTIPWHSESAEYQDSGHYISRSAHYLLLAGNPSFDYLKDKVVVIGASFAESHDLHATPLGEMPGSLILINAIKSINQWGQITTPPSWIKWLIEAVLIVFMAWIYAKANSFTGTLVIGGVILAIFVPVSFWLFKAGMWVDFAIPIFGMQLHQLIAEYEEKIMLKAQQRQK